MFYAGLSKAYEQVEEKVTSKIKGELKKWVSKNSSGLSEIIKEDSKPRRLLKLIELAADLKGKESELAQITECKANANVADVPVNAPSDAPTAPKGSLQGCLLSNAGYYLSADHDQKTIRADKRECGPWERFEFVDRNGGTLDSGDEVLIRSPRGRYLSAQDWGGLEADRVWDQAWERFEMVRTVGSGRILDSQYVAFRSTAHNKWMVAEKGGIPGQPMNVNRDARGPWETYVLKLTGVTGGGRTPSGQDVDLFETFKPLPEGTPPKAAGILYAIQARYLYAYVHDADLKFRVQRKQIGGGWGNQFRFVFAGDPGVIYAVTTGGELLAYVHDENFNWVVTAKHVGSSWGSQFRHIFAGGGGVIYGVTTGSELVYYRHDKNWKFVEYGKKIGSGFGPEYARIVSGGDGRIYAIHKNGTPYYYKHDASLKWTDQRRVIGSGWNMDNHFKHLLSPGAGVVYLTDKAANLFYARHGAVPAKKGVAPSWDNFQQIGTHWGNQFTYIFAGRLN
jgi:hypothetical protein